MNAGSDRKSSRERIDTHTHVVPPDYLAWLRANRDYGGAVVDWNVDAALEAMDSKGIATAILSVSSPSVRWGPGDDPVQVRKLARAVNEFCGELVRADPGHFGFFATVTLPDLDGSLEEARYALDDLGADGVIVLGNVDGVYVGAPQWDPLMQLLDDRASVLFIHPTALPGPPVEGITAGVVDFLADSTRAAVNLVKHDCPRRYSRLRILLSHGGGFVPFAAARIASMISREADEADVLAQLRTFYFDTALTGPYALPSLLAFADLEHVTYGSDWPYEFRPDQSRRFTEGLDAFDLTGEQRHAIDRGNAERLFPRLARVRSS
ncbi:amidohydrolase family protein [Amycolatopsis sp. CA-126428]|uniref:amidohydrolase family protein n=1 Tax=Amycolatopsis sp. CA-126428 TaxID=2073158 RepID=UPI000CD309B6|nr:amidohydrolase family protein [Amycolatopsis sp. CA-126428]